MTQYARPDGDLSLGGLWEDAGAGRSNIYQSIDESSANDSDYIANSADGMTTPDWAKFSLGDINDPESGSNHKIIYRAVGTWMMTEPSLIVSLYQSTTQIATATNSSLNNQASFGSFATYTITLTSSEANNISDYDALAIWFKRSPTGDMADDVKISQAYFECPDAAAAAAATSPAFLLFME